MKRLVILLSVLALTVGTAATAVAAQQTKRYKSCTAVWKKYPNGIVSSTYFVDVAVKAGNKPPTVSREYFDNYRLARNYVVCAVVQPDVVPSAPTITTSWASPSGLTITAIWDKPANAGLKSVSDVYLNGNKVDEGLTGTSYTWRNLAAATSYTIGVTTRNPAGTSPMATATATTNTQEQADHPGQVKVTYSGTGTVDVTMQSSSGTSQFDNVTNPTYEFWFKPGAFVYFSVQNQNDSGDVSCSVKSAGRTVASNSSSGAYVIATCSGKA
jgi:hypothetical protein